MAHGKHAGLFTLCQNKDGKYVFPFCEDLEQILEPNQKEEYIAKVNAEVAAKKRPLVPRGTGPPPVP
jgi:hypothetical protein